MSDIAAIQKVIADIRQQANSIVAGVTGTRDWLSARANELEKAIEPRQTVKVWDWKE